MEISMNSGYCSFYSLVVIISLKLYFGSLLCVFFTLLFFFPDILENVALTSKSQASVRCFYTTLFSVFKDILPQNEKEEIWDEMIVEIKYSTVKTSEQECNNKLNETVRIFLCQ